MNTQTVQHPPTGTLVAQSLCMALQMTGFVMILPLFARRFESFGAGVEALGISATAYAVASTAAAPCIRILAGRFGRRPILLRSLSAYVLAFIGDLFAVSTWLHALRTVVFIGHFILLAPIYLPAMKDQPEIPVGVIPGKSSKQSRAWMYAALLICMITGIHLMLVDSYYLGVGKFGNLWSILMLVKYVSILRMIAAGYWFNVILRVEPMLSSKTGSSQVMDLFRPYNNGVAVTGILVLLLTALSQAK